MYTVIDCVSLLVPLRSIVSSNVSPLNSACSASCMCNSTVFEPICGVDGITYFSPCQAACQKYYIDGDPLVCPITCMLHDW